MTLKKTLTTMFLCKGWKYWTTKLETDEVKQISKQVIEIALYGNPNRN